MDKKKKDGYFCEKESLTQFHVTKAEEEELSKSCFLYLN